MAEAQGDVIYFAKTNFRGSDKLFGIRRADRRQHTYLVGKTGTGKSALLNNLIVQDIANGEGLCVVDPHGELVESILTKIPAERAKDVVYFNPADTDYHIGFNVLELPDPKYKHLVASGLMGIFTKIWAGVWSARMEYILNNAILALLDTPGTTLLGITRILVDKEYRQNIIQNVTDPVVKAFWINEYEQWKDQFRNEAIAPIQNKVGQFLSTALVRNIVGQSKSTIDIFELMNSGKILLVNVSKGRIGEDNSALLGSMIITKIQLSAMERVRVKEDERVDFFLYVDEFQNFATDSFANILSEARKYRLDLTLAHQYIGQLVTDVSTKVRDAVFGNVGTMIMFRIGAADAEFLESEFEPEVMPQDMVNLPNHHIYLKLMVNGITSRPFSATTLPPFKVEVGDTTEDEIIQGSRKRYARPRYIVEEEINRWSGMMMGAPGSGAFPGKEHAGSGFAPGGASRGGFSDGTFEPEDRPTLRPEQSGGKYTEALADLGIEFKPSPKEPPRRADRRHEHIPTNVDRRARPFGHKESPQSSFGEHTIPRPPHPAPHHESRAETRSAAPMRKKQESLSERPVRAEEKTLSLADLKPRDKTAHERASPVVDIDSLKQAIAESLKKGAGADEETPHKKHTV